MKFLKYIKEIFNSKNYTWINISVAYFQVQHKDYYVHFDLIGKDSYNLYFYYLNTLFCEISELFNLVPAGRGLDGPGPGPGPAVGLAAARGARSPSLVFSFFIFTY